jgi:hypothetical protein
MEERQYWLLVGVLVIGLLTLVLWPYLWLVRLCAVTLLVTGTTFVILRGFLGLRGLYLEQQKNRHFVWPTDRRLPAVFDEVTGTARALEPPPLAEHLRLSIPTAVLPPGGGDLDPTTPLRAPHYLEAIRKARRGELILGWSRSGPIWKPLKDVRSISLVGKSGTGKTNTERWLLGQFVELGAQVTIWDGHGDISEELGGLTDYGEILASAEGMREEFERRKGQYRKGQRDFPPVVLLIDEWKEMHRAVKKAKAIVSDLITGGRKFQMYLVVSGQYLLADMFESSGDLDSIWTHYLHWTDQRQAEYARVTDQEAVRLLDELRHAGPGYAIISHPQLEVEIVAIPRTESSDLSNRTGGGEVAPPGLPPF